jgi:hypothetical protein
MISAFVLINCHYDYHNHLKKEYRKLLLILAEFEY